MSDKEALADLKKIVEVQYENVKTLREENANLVDRLATMDDIVSRHTLSSCERKRILGWFAQMNKRLLSDNDIRLAEKLEKIND